MVTTLGGVVLLLLLLLDLVGVCTEKEQKKKMVNMGRRAGT